MVLLQEIVLPSIRKVLPRRFAAKAARRAVDARPRDVEAFSDPAAILGRLLEQDIVSFDLFDTLVTRRVALDVVHQKTADFADAFLRGDNGPLPTGLIAHARHRLMQDVKDGIIRKSNGTRNEFDLADVFDAALKPYVKIAKARQRAVAGLIAHEVETEKAVLTVDPEMLALLRLLKAADRRLILISDMYLAAPKIEEILRSLGLGGFFEHVFVSASVGVTKHSGLMFSHVDRVLRLDGLERIHIGDNLENDVRQPRLMGWQALHYASRGHETRREMHDEMARLRPKGDRKDFRDLLRDYPVTGDLGIERLTAAGFAIFARRVLGQAIQGRFDRVLFLSRDGTRFRQGIVAFLSQTAAGEALSFPVMEDMAFSRRAGVLLNYPEMEDPQWQGFLAWNVNWLNGTPLSIRTIMRTFGLLLEDLVGLAPDLLSEVAGYLKDNDPATDLGFSELVKRPDLCIPLHRALASRRDRVRDYLEGLGLFDRNEKILLVDIGYSGTAMKSLSEYMFRCDAARRPVRSRLEMMLLAANRYHAGNLRQMHPRITLRPGELIGTQDWRHRAATVNFAWLEPFAVDRSCGALRDYAPDAQGRLQPVFGEASQRSDDLALVERMAKHAADYEKALRRSSLPVAEADRLVLSRWIGEVISPSLVTTKAMHRHRHQAGAGEVKEQGMLTHVRANSLVADITHCLERDCWVQGSLRRSRLGLTIPFVNRIVALEAK